MYGQAIISLVCYMYSTLMILSGMEMVVSLPVPVAHSIILHTSPKSCLHQPLMILNCDCVAIYFPSSYEDVAAELIELYVK